VLSAFSSIVDSGIVDVLEKSGCAQLKLASADELLEIAQALGDPVGSRRSDPIVQPLTPVARAKASPRSLSAAHGLGAFPFHTDAAHHLDPPRWVVLRCADPGPSRRPTLWKDSEEFDLADEERRLLRRSVWRVAARPRPFLAAVYTKGTAGVDRIRFDPGCMTPADPSFDDAARLLQVAIASAQAHEVYWDRNDALILDNGRCLHARAAGDVSDASVRRLERVLIRERPRG
jgi:L-asparagine oxygenase